MNPRDKVRGLFLGVAIGDALGLPAEVLTDVEIAQRWGRIDRYLANPQQKFFGDAPAGSWSDDTQLTLAVARAFVRAGGFDLDAVALAHAEAFRVSTRGWGPTTREAAARMAASVHWSEAADTAPGRGLGNGVAMKAGPVGLYLALTNPERAEPSWSVDIEKLAHFATMTHRTSVGVASGFAQALAVLECFRSTPDGFDVGRFIATVREAGEMGRRYLPETIGGEDIATRFGSLERHGEYPPGRCVEEFGGGSSRAYDSLPFAYMFFVRNPRTADVLYDVVSAGGDTDTTGSMVGALLGALHGCGIFPDHLVEGLCGREEVLETADQFYARFAR